MKFKHPFVFLRESVEDRVSIIRPCCKAYFCPQQEERLPISNEVMVKFSYEDSS